MLILSFDLDLQYFLWEITRSASAAEKWLSARCTRGATWWAACGCLWIHKACCRWCGADNTLVLVESGEVYSCGLGADWQTGLGHFRAVAEPTLVRGALAGVRVVQLSCRGDTALAVSSDGELFGWGNAEYGQLTSAGEALLRCTRRALSLVSRARSPPANALRKRLPATPRARRSRAPACSSGAMCSSAPVRRPTSCTLTARSRCLSRSSGAPTATPNAVCATSTTALPFFCHQRWATRYWFVK